MAASSTFMGSRVADGVMLFMATILNGLLAVFAYLVGAFSVMLGDSDPHGWDLRLVLSIIWLFFSTTLVSVLSIPCLWLLFALGKGIWAGWVALFPIMYALGFVVPMEALLLFCWSARNPSPRRETTRVPTLQPQLPLSDQTRDLGCDLGSEVEV